MDCVVQVDTVEDPVKSVKKEAGAAPRRSANIRLVARHPDVYEPCDDTFALVDALLADKTNILRDKPDVCVEVGCGSGYVITSLALLIGSEHPAQYIATDISEAAAGVTRRTLEAHDVKAEVFVTNLVAGLEDRLTGSVDLLVCNPPYVPTPEEEVGAPGLTASWAGGSRGRAVIDRMLALADELLTSKGCMYLVTLAQNNPCDICRVMSKRGFASRIVIQRNTEEEKLLVLKFWRDEFHSDWSEYSSSPPTSDLSFTSKMARLATFWR